jgi:hypothetical protein
VTQFENLDQGLREARERARRFDHLAGRRSAIAAQVREVSELIGQLEAELAKERHDVARLEGGFARFVAGLVAETAGAHESHRRLLAEKERLLVELGDDRRARLVELSTLLADAQADLREYEEALQAGMTAGQVVGEMLSLLNKARRASAWDMLGGGAYTDAVERHHLKAADQTAWHAQRALDVFSRELADLGWVADPRLPEVDTRWFADVFFDNIITDALKHQRINRTRDAVAEMSQWVGEAVRTLTQRSVELQQRRGELLVERERLVAA